MKLNYIYYSVLLFILPISCKKAIEVAPPTNNINGENVYSDPTTAAAVLTGIYGTISVNTMFISPALNSLSFFLGMSADELTLYRGVTFPLHNSYYKNDLKSNTAGFEFWNNTYPLIYKTNAAIEGISRSTSMHEDVKNQLLGEAKFIRALCYFYLVNLYGNVPLVLTTNAIVNAGMGNAPKEQTWQQILTDLKDAQNLMKAQYLTSNSLVETNERTRPNKWAATALLARCYLYTSAWADAEDQASAVIKQNNLYDTVSLSDVFLKTSKEAIWQIQPVRNAENTQDARLFNIPATRVFSVIQPVYLNDSLWNRFEATDLRKKRWIDSTAVFGNFYHYPSKYKVFAYGSPVTEYLMVIRLSELYLIRAEARAQQNKISEAKSDLNVIRSRAGLANTTADTKQQLLTAILQERQVELFTEWGHRWLDLKRTGNLNATMTSMQVYKNIQWDATDELFPIPITDIKQNKNLEQNTGY